jgi:hypothetical protein
MKKQNITSYDDLVLAKVAIINFHKGDVNEYLRMSIARDACYTSFNSIEWKSSQMSDIKNEVAQWRRENPDAEVIDVKIGAKLALYNMMEDELIELQDRHNADCEVYTIITQGEVWQRKPKRTYKSDGLAEIAAIDKLLAS